uniref:Uncharacterized protein n=1 Tax=Arundo donax TaxID=35708 RepID=A0A0A9B4N9_ARUDO
MFLCILWLRACVEYLNHRISMTHSHG